MIFFIYTLSFDLFSTRDYFLDYTIKVKCLLASKVNVMKKWIQPPKRSANNITQEKLDKVSGGNRRPLTRKEARQELLKRINPGSRLDRLKHL